MSYRDDVRSVQSEVFWSLPRIVLAGLISIVLIYGAGFLMTGGDLAIYSFWAPKQANAENRVFHETQAFTDGKITYIGRLCAESAKADGAQKAALDNEIVDEASTVNINKLPADEQGGVSRAKGY